MSGRATNCSSLPGICRRLRRQSSLRTVAGSPRAVGTRTSRSGMSPMAKIWSRSWDTPMAWQPWHSHRREWYLHRAAKMEPFDSGTSRMARKSSRCGVTPEKYVPLPFRPTDNRWPQVEAMARSKIWDAATGEEWYSFQGHDRLASAVTFRPKAPCLPQRDGIK